MVGAVFPLSAVGDTYSVWVASNKALRVLPALLSSLVCDFAARFKVGGTHLNFFIAEQIPILTPEVFDRPVPWATGESVGEWLLPHVLELTYTAWALEPFAVECGWDGPPFHWDEDRRFLLRCELDAAFFHLYLPADEDGDWRPARPSDGCPCDETLELLAIVQRTFPTPRDAVAYIMDTFPIVRRKDEGKHEEYRTKRVTLEIYDAIQKSVIVGDDYKSSLNPPPAHRSGCHPIRES